MQGVSNGEKLLSSQVTSEELSSSQITDTFLRTIIELKYDLSAKADKIQKFIDEFKELQKEKISGTALITGMTKEVAKMTKQIKQNSTFPVEIFDEISARCDAQTKLNLSSICKGLNERYKIWKEVKSVYITRRPIKFLPSKTIIPQSFIVKTNVPCLSSFYSTSLVSMIPKLSKVRQLFIESSEQPMANLTNQIPIQSGFFQHLQEVQFIKICNGGDNLSLNYTLEELFSLPKLEVLHIRESRNNMPLPCPSFIQAPLKELRLAIKLSKVNRLSKIFDKLHLTLECLELVLLKPYSTLGNYLRRDLLLIIVTRLPNLKDLYLNYAITKHPNFNQNLYLLKNLTKLKYITFEIIHLESLPNIINDLPSTCETIVVIESFYIRGEKVRLSPGSQYQLEEIFSLQKIELLRSELHAVNRKINIQLGRLRENCLITVRHDINSFVTFVSNITAYSWNSLTNVDKRVFLFNRAIYNRGSFLNKLGITTENNSS